MDSMLGLVNSFKRTNNQSYKQANDGKTHLVNVSLAISKFGVLEDYITEQYTDVIELSEFERKIVSVASNSKIVRMLINAEKKDKKALGNEISKFLCSDSIDDIITNNVKSKEQGLDYAVAVAILDDYVDYLNTGIYSGPATIIK